MYAMVCSRPDTALAIIVLSRFLSNPSKKHWNAVKWVMRYLKGTTNLNLNFGGEKPMLVGITNANIGDDINS